MMNNKVGFTNSNNPTISLSAVIYFPQNLMKPVSIRQLWYLTQVGALKNKRPDYAKKLAEKDFITVLMTHLIKVKVAASRVELKATHSYARSISAVIDYLTTLSYVDNTELVRWEFVPVRIRRDNTFGSRIKAISTVSAVNIGSMFRNGWKTM